MKLTWHIVLKDLRRLWPWLAVLVGAMLARYANFYAIDYDSLSSNVRLLNRIQLIDGVMLGVSLLATALAVATLVHEDPVTGDRAFWLTRPIGGLRLLAAKTLTWALVLVAAPLIVQLGWWYFHSYSFAEIAAQLPILAARHAGVAFPCLLCALFTRHLGPFLLTTIISALTVVASHVLMEDFLMSKSRTNETNRLILETCVSVLVASACIAHQYLTRRTKRTLLMAVSGLLACLAINSAWRWPIFPTPSRIDQMPVLAPDTGMEASVSTPVSKLMRTGDLSSSSPAGATTRNRRFLAAPLTLAPVPPGYFVDLLNKGNFKHDSLTLSYAQILFPHPVPSSEYAYEGTLALNPKNGADVPSLLEPRSCELTFALRRPFIATRLPLQEGASGYCDARSLRIARIWNWAGKMTRHVKFNDGTSVTVTTTSKNSERSLSLALEEILPSHLPDVHGTYAEEDGLFGLGSLSDYYARPPTPRHTYFLINTRTGETISPINIRPRGSIFTDGVQHRVIELTFPVVMREDEAAHFQFHKVLAPLVGTFRRQVVIPAATWTQPSTP